MNFGKDSRFAALADEVRACRRCDRMCESTRVLSFAAGNLRARAMFIGEAPGRLGADQTEIPFHGDAAGHNFEALLALVGIRRDQVFVSNAVLCNPKGADGNNATPTGQELSNCSLFLRRQIELVDPLLVVTLGAVALRAASAIEAHSLALAEDVRTTNAWFGRTLIPLYHPGQRALIHRSAANQRADFQFVAEQLRRTGRSPNKPSGASRSDIAASCRYLLAHRGALSYFMLHKLVYMAEYVHVKSTGHRLTSAFFIRQKDGPYCTDLHIDKLKRADPEIRTFSKGGQLFVAFRREQRPQLLPELARLEPEWQQTLDEVLARYGATTDADLKRVVYLTGPMRLILRREMRDHVNLFNAPIDFMETNQG